MDLTNGRCTVNTVQVVCSSRHDRYEEPTTFDSIAHDLAELLEKRAH